MHNNERVPAVDACVYGVEGRVAAEMGDEEQEVVFRCLVKTPRQTDPSKVL